jgi:predicted dehydrogenase
MRMESIGIGLVGYGMIGRVHTLAYRELPLFYPQRLPALHLAAVCTSRSETAQAAAAEAGFASWCTDISALVGREDVHVVDCSVPNHLHRSVLLAAIAAGKHIYCEKPLALDGAEARELVMAARKAGVCAGMTFNYRFVPAIMRARQLIHEGALGEVYTFRAEYLHSGYQDPQRPAGWKTRREQAGGGALVDLGSHVIDLIRHLLGEFRAVRANLHTFIKERPVRHGATEKEPVTVDDVAWVQVQMENGSMGTIEVSRFATGMLDDLRLEIYGQRGALRFSLMDANWLYWYDATRSGEPLGGTRGWTRIETVQNYPGAAAPPARSILGWTRTHAENQYSFLRALVEGKTPQPDIVDGLRTQLVLDAAYASAESGEWTSVQYE